MLGTCFSLNAKAILIQISASSGSLMKIINKAGCYISPLLVLMISFACGLSANSKSTISPSKPEWIKFSKKLSLTLHQKTYSNVNKVLATALSSGTNFMILLFTTRDLGCLRRILYSMSCCFICTVLLCRSLWGMWHLEICLNICCWGTMWLPVKLVKWGKRHKSIIHRLTKA